MPNAPRRPCATPGCREFQPCPTHRRKAYDIERGTATQRGYNARWQRYRLAFLAKHPLCIQHQAAGETVAATVVDHIIPHRGDAELFWRESNHQALCASCHGVKSQAERLT